MKFTHQAYNEMVQACKDSDSTIKAFACLYLDWVTLPHHFGEKIQKIFVFDKIRKIKMVLMSHFTRFPVLNLLISSANDQTFTQCVQHRL